MRRLRWVLAAFAVVAAWSNTSSAQTSGGFDDPFFLYFSYFLPRQAALAAQPNVNDTINQNVANNQVNARTNRSGIYDPNGGYGAFDNYDPNDTFERPGGARGINQSRRGFRGLPSTNIAGRGPALYYNRAAQFYPSLRNGTGPNRNLAVTGRGVRGGGSVPSAASGMSQGPR
jgi:hypothetical protein